MEPDAQKQRFVYHTKSVCPPEIHFQIQNEYLQKVRFVGGGCPGNAQLVCRLLEGRPLKEVLNLLKGILCRNGTSCPNQLAKALIAATEGRLEPAPSFQIHKDPSPRNRIGLIGDLDGNRGVLEVLIQTMREREVEGIYCLGNLIGASIHDIDLIHLLRKENITAIQGERDRQLSLKEPEGDGALLGPKERDYLFRLPHVLSFQMGETGGVAFFGEYIQRLPGFSDFDPFALEINMVCSLTQFMQDETVFPALEAMISQFKAHIILFSQIQKWGYWTIGGTHFISLGPALLDHRLTWGLLEMTGNEIDFKIMEKDISTGG